MAYLNRFTFIGNITKDPEIVMKGETKIARISLAQNRTKKDRDGNKTEEALFFNMSAFGKLADIIEQYCQKGKQVYIEATIVPYTQETDDGKKYGFSFNIEQLSMLGNKGDGSQKGGMSVKDVADLF